MQLLHLFIFLVKSSVKLVKSYKQLSTFSYNRYRTILIQ